MRMGKWAWAQSSLTSSDKAWIEFYSKSPRKSWEPSEQRNDVILLTCLGHLSWSVELAQEQKSRAP